MTGFEGIILGFVISLVIGFALKNKEPTFLYLFAGASFLDGIAALCNRQPHDDIVPAFGVSILLIYVGFLLSRKSKSSKT